MCFFKNDIAFRLYLVHKLNSWIGLGIVSLLFGNTIFLKIVYFLETTNSIHTMLAKLLKKMSDFTNYFPWD